jgi:hypothetical protein
MRKGDESRSFVAHKVFTSQVTMPLQVDVDHLILRDSKKTRTKDAVPRVIVPTTRFQMFQISGSV